MTTGVAPTRLHQLVAKWYSTNRRELPWRNNIDPYWVLVSEVMLQQTQVERVIPKFQEFVEKFPSLEALATASPGDVIKAWAGLGYNSRAVRLRLLAIALVSADEGTIPNRVDDLRRLPGIGRYTAGAIACFAFGASVALADTNIYRVLSRVAYGLTAPSRKTVDELVERLVPTEGASVWYQGLMDIGATICLSARPTCGRCPLRQLCTAAPLLETNASPETARSSVPYAPKQSTFKGSRRQYRGRILAALRTLPDGEDIGVDVLIESLRETYGGTEDDAWSEELLAGLVKEGLVRFSETFGSRRIALP